MARRSAVWLGVKKTSTYGGDSPTCTSSILANSQLLQSRLLVLRVPYISYEVEDLFPCNRLALSVRRASEVDGDAFSSRHAMDLGFRFWPASSAALVSAALIGSAIAQCYAQCRA